MNRRASFDAATLPQSRKRRGSEEKRSRATVGFAPRCQCTAARSRMPSMRESSGSPRQSESEHFAEKPIQKHLQPSGGINQWGASLPAKNAEQLKKAGHFHAGHSGD